MSLSTTSTFFFIQRPTLLILGLIVSICAPLSAQTSRKISETLKQESGKKIQTKADSLNYDQNSGELNARGNVIITYNKIRLLADHVRVNTETRQAHAEGNVRLRQGQKEWKTQSLDYNFDTGAMNASTARATLDDGIFFESESLESKDTKKFVMRNSYFTTSDYEKPGYRFKASSISVYPSEKIVMENVVLYVGSVPVFYFPYLVWALNDDDYDGFNSGTSIQVGTKGGWGFFVLNSYAAPVNSNFRPTYLFDYRTDRGFAGGVNLRFKGGEMWSPDSGKAFEPGVSGKSRLYYTYDEKIAKSGPVKVVTSTEQREQTLNPHRYQVKFSSFANLRDDVYAKAKVNKLSDSNYLEDFYEQEFQSDPQPDNFFSITKWSPRTTLSILARPQFNDFYTTTERLPEIEFDILRQPLFSSPFFYESQNSYSYLSKEFSDLSPNEQDFHSQRIDSFHQITAPQKLFGFLNVTPRIGARATFYDHSRLGSDQPAILRGVFNAGFDAGFKIHRTWNDLQDATWDIHGLRHIIEPSVSYGFVLTPNHRPNEIYPFDVEQSSSGIQENLVPIHFPQYTGIDSIDKRNIFRPTLSQRLQTKRKGAIVNLADLLMYQDIRADKVPGETTLSDFFATLSAQPLEWVNLSWKGRYDWDHDQVRETRARIGFHDKKNWELGLSHYYFRDVGNQLGIDFKWALNEDWAFRSSHRFDPFQGELFEQTYAIDRDFHSWIVTLASSQLRPLDRDADFRVWLAFTLKAFPEVSFDSKSIGGGNR